MSKTIWWMSVIFSDNETAWIKLWPQDKYRSPWPIFHGLVILLNIFKITWWMNIIVGIMDQCDTEIDLIKFILLSTDFVSYLEDYLMEKYCILDNGSVWHKVWPCKIYIWVIDLYFMVHWFCLISCHTLELFLYFKNWRRQGVFVPGLLL